MGEPRIIVGDGYSKEKVCAALAAIMGQVLSAGVDLPLPTMKRQDKGPFNRAKERARRARQIQRLREKG